MRRRQGIRALFGIAFCAAGLWLAVGAPYHPRTFRIQAGGCGLITDILEPAGEEATPRGYVILLHGLAANKRIMSYFAQGFANVGLRVFVPDLPGHGRTPGPFSYDHAEQCSQNLLQELAARGLLDADRTLLAGHSLGGAIALRVASRVPVAGVVAVSPAPVRAVPGLPVEAMPFREFGSMPAHALLLYGGWEPGRISAAARDLVPSASGDTTSEYLLIPRATHVSILFDATALQNAQNWAANVLHLQARRVLPSRRGVAGFLLGLVGIFTLAGPFLGEILETKNHAVERESEPGVSRIRLFLEFGIAAIGAAVILRFVNPLRAVRLFEGDYFTALLLIVGVVVLTLNWKAALGSALGTAQAEAVESSSRYLPILLAAFAAALLYVLLSTWFELSFMEAWPTAPRMLRFVPLTILVLPYHFAEEMLLGPAFARPEWVRLATALALRLVVWLMILVGILFLHSGQIIPVVLAPAFALFSLGQRWGMDLTRRATASPAASALFGAILLAGFCLVAFPAT